MKPLPLPHPAGTKSCTLSLLDSCYIGLFPSCSIITSLIKTTTISGLGYWRGYYAGLPASNLISTNPFSTLQKRMVCNIPMGAWHWLWGYMLVRWTFPVLWERAFTLSGLPTCSSFCLNIFCHHPPQLGPLPSMGVHIMAFLYKIFSEPCLITTFLIHTPELSLLSLPKPSPTSLKLLLRLPIFFGPMKVTGIGGEESGNTLCSLGMNEAKEASSLRFLASKVRGGHNCGS